MTKITYRSNPTRTMVSVIIDGRCVGNIMKLAYDAGWSYTPHKSSVRGETFKTLAECKKSLETA